MRTDQYWEDPKMESLLLRMPPDKRNLCSKSLVVGLSLWILLVLFFIANLLSNPEYMPKKSEIWKDCGSSPTEAKQRGCKFDILSFAWQTKECHDEDLLNDFINAGSWKFYKEPSSTSTSVPLEVANRGELDLFVDWEYHVWHCTFMWRQMHRAFTVRGYIDSHLDNYAHTKHCQHALLNRSIPMDTVNVIGALKYPQCRQVQVGEPFPYQEIS